MTKPRAPTDTAQDRSHGGRPKAVEPGTSLTTWVPVSEYARLCRIASHRGETLSATVRAWLAMMGNDKR